MRVWIAGCFVIASGMAQPGLPEGPGRDALIKVCSGCHSPESVIGMAKTREDWAALVGDMVNQGAQGSDEEFARIIDYLAANFPAKVNVNTAGPQLLESALDLSEKEAAALVAYREQNGKFKSIEDLAKVPGVDRRKIEARKDRIEY
jgi:competence protein ComEA